MGITNLAFSPPPAHTTGGSSPTFFVVLLLLFAAFYFLMIRPQRNRQRRVMQVQSEVSPGQRIRTTAGLYGTIVSGDDRDVVVEIAPGVQVTMLRRAIMEVLPDDDGGPEPDEDEPQDSAEYDHESDDESPDDSEHPFDQTVSADFDSRDAEEQPNGSAPADKRAADKRKTKDSNI